MFYDFSRMTGVSFAEPPTDLLEPVGLGDIVAHNLIASPQRRKAVDAHIAEYYWARRMLGGFRMRPSLVRIRDAQFVGPHLSCGDAIVLNGAAGDRARNALRRSYQNPAEASSALRAMFDQLADPETLEIAPPPGTGAGPDQLIVECRNFFNFFHMCTESLHLPAALPPATLRAFDRVMLYARGLETRDFADAWTRAAYRDLRVHLCPGLPSSRQQVEGSVHTVLSAKHLLYQLAGSHHAQITTARPGWRKWEGYDAHPHAVAVLDANSFDASLSAFRQGLIGWAKGTTANRWGPLIYAARSQSGARPRIMHGEQELIARLKPLGFAVVCFEDLTPAEQVLCVSEAECVVMQHGAGMANMIFASDTAHVIEIGTSQTAFARWADFIPLCHVAGCHYHAVFTDMDLPDDCQPNFKEHGLLPPWLGSTAIDQIVEVIGDAIRDRNTGVLSGFRRHSDSFLARRAYNQAARLADYNDGLLGSDALFWTQKARLGEAVSNTRAARDSYFKAWELSGDEASWTRFVSLAGPEDKRLSMRG